MAAVAPPDNLDPPPSTPPVTATPPAATATATATSTPPNPTTPNPTTPNPNPIPAPVSTPPAVAPPFVSFAPSFRPLGAPPLPQMPQYGAVPNTGYSMAQPMQPPGVPPVMPPGAVRPHAMYAPQPGAFLPQPGAAVPPAVVVPAVTPYGERCRLMFDSAALTEALTDHSLPHCV